MLTRSAVLWPYRLAGQCITAIPSSGCRNRARATLRTTRLCLRPKASRVPQTTKRTNEIGCVRKRVECHKQQKEQMKSAFEENDVITLSSITKKSKNRVVISNFTHSSSGFSVLTAVLVAGVFVAAVVAVALAAAPGARAPSAPFSALGSRLAFLATGSGALNAALESK